MMFKKVILLAVVLPAGIVLAQKLSVRPNLPSPQPVGTPVVWTATTTVTNPQYQFSVLRSDGQQFIVQDYSGSNTLSWTSLQEGSYQIVVAQADGNSGRLAQKKSPSFTFVSRAAGNPVVSPTQHPLVALYSAPPCSAGQVQVQFQPVGTASWKTTPAQSCNGTSSLNFYVAGMLQNTAYILKQLTNNGGTIIEGPALNFQTGAAPFIPPAASVLSAPTVNTSSEGVLLTSLMGSLSVPGS